MVKFPFVHQDGIKDCGAACMQMIIKYYGGYLSLSELSEKLNTNKLGTSAYDMVKTSENLGFASYGIKTTLNELNANNIILPCIAHVTLENSYKHYMVIYKIDFVNKKITIADPMKKVMKISFNEFNNIWNNILLILYPVKPIPQNKEISIYQFILNTLIKYKQQVIELAVLSLLIMCFSVVTSFYFKTLFEDINLEKPILFYVFILFIILNFIKLMTEFIRTKLLLFINGKIDLSINIDSYSMILSLPYRYFRNRTTGEITSKIADLNKIRNIINKLLLIFFFDVPLTLISGITLLLLNSKLFLIAFLILIFNSILTLLTQKPVSNKIEECYKDKADVTSYMVESISGIETLKGLGAINTATLKYEKKYVSYLKRMLNLDAFLNFQNFLSEIISTFGELSIIFMGCMLISNNEISVGTLIAFNSMLMFFLYPIKNILSINVHLSEAKKAYKQIFEIYFEKKKDGVYNYSFGNIYIKNLNYNFRCDKQILKDINLEIEKGEHVLVCGESGSGKSTLLKILMQYYEVPRNHVFIANTDINDLKNHNKKISYISQNEILFTDSIYNNLSLVNKNEHDIKQVVKICQIDEFLKDINLGLNMIIEENGFNISGGQKQRIVLARALLNNSDIILIDEGLNQIDINMERKILKSIFENYKHKTVIIVSHRLENMDLYDRILKLENGRIISNCVRAT